MRIEELRLGDTAVAAFTVPPASSATIKDRARSSADCDIGAGD